MFTTGPDQRKGRDTLKLLLRRKVFGVAEAEPPRGTCSGYLAEPLNTDRHIIEWTEHLANWLTNRGHQGLLALIKEFIENKG